MSVCAESPSRVAWGGGSGETPFLSLTAHWEVRNEN